MYADIGQLLSFELKKSHSVPLASENGSFLLSENSVSLMTEGWNLMDAAQEVRNKIFANLPTRERIKLPA